MELFAASATHPVFPIILAFFISGGAVLRAWISYRRVEIREKSRTERFSSAIDGSRPDERPEIIRACSELENSTDKLAVNDHNETADPPE